MLSVCIPVYNFKIADLLEKLDVLLKKTDIEYEILVVDDESDQYFKNQNEKIAGLIGARFIPLEKNKGRSAIRNYLCKTALFENLLFLDCDSVIEDENYINQYLNYINKEVVVYGGTKYQHFKPQRKYRLHWNYGRKREIKPVAIRNKFSYHYFKTNNFLIPRLVLAKYPFNELLKGYGHEDTLMGVQLSQNNIPVFHIDNPVLHAGLETNDQFVLKTRESIKNLLFISEKCELAVVNKHFKLLNAFSKIQNLNLVGILKIIFRFSQPLLLFVMKNFYLMKVLDLYKLGFLCSIYKKSTALSNDAFSEK